MVKTVSLTKCNIVTNYKGGGVKMDPKPFLTISRGVSCCVQGGSTPLNPLTNTALGLCCFVAAWENAFLLSYTREQMMTCVTAILLYIAIIFFRFNLFHCVCAPPYLSHIWK